MLAGSRFDAIPMVGVGAVGWGGTTCEGRSAGACTSRVGMFSFGAPGKSFDQSPLGWSFEGICSTTTVSLVEAVDAVGRGRFAVHRLPETLALRQVHSNLGWERLAHVHLNADPGATRSNKLSCNFNKHKYITDALGDGK